MVSIGKLGGGQARYYLDQAHHARSAAAAVASGVEDYYTGGVEAAGAWTGAASRGLGLNGPVDDELLHLILEGCHPATGDLLRLRGTVPGFDVTFSAPKSVSVLFGVGDAHVRDAVEVAHQRAVAEALGYLDRHAATDPLARGALADAGGLGRRRQRPFQLQHPATEQQPALRTEPSITVQPHPVSSLD
jgi:conjugative relaxase-like TrwC/TraI family protein